MRHLGANRALSLATLDDLHLHLLTTEWFAATAIFASFVTDELDFLHHGLVVRAMNR